MASREAWADLDNYVKRIKDYSLISAEEERDLARRYREGDEGAGHRIVTANLRFVVRFSRSYFHLGYRPLEIIQEGNMGLVKALVRYDPERGVRFIYYAIWWIRAYIHNFIQMSYKVHTGRLSHARGLISLDACLGDDGQGDESLGEYLCDENADQETCYAHKEHAAVFRDLLAVDPHLLTDREMFIIRERFFRDPPSTLKEIAEQIGVSRERVRQIEARSLERMRVSIEEHHLMKREDLFASHEVVQRHKPF